LGFFAVRTAGAGGLWGVPAREGLLFDNCIGRKRDVDGGVLAGIFARNGFRAVSEGIL